MPRTVKSMDAMFRELAREAALDIVGKCQCEQWPVCCVCGNAGLVEQAQERILQAFAHAFSAAAEGASPYTNISAARFGKKMTIAAWLEKLAEERGALHAHEDSVNLLRAAAWIRKARSAGVAEEVPDIGSIASGS